jgi:hypothetical protein
MLCFLTARGTEGKYHASPPLNGALNEFIWLCPELSSSVNFGELKKHYDG